MKKTWRQTVGAMVFLGMPFAAFGQAATPAPSGSSGPGSIPVGPMLAYPGLDLAVGHDNNLFYSNTNRQSSTFTRISPYVTLEGKTGPHTFGVTARLEHGRFLDSSQDNYTDWSLLGNADIVFSGRAGLKLRAEHRAGHDPRGSTDRPAGGTPDEYTNTGIDGVFSYGAPGAQGRIEVDGGAFRREYQNNRLFTAASDRDTRVFGGSFFWRVAPKTELLFGAQQRDIDYQLSTSTLDSTERRFFLGAKWEATAATTGTVRYGRLTKDFDSNTRSDFSTNNSWDAAIRWSPLTYSVVDLNTSKLTNESSGVGDFIVTKTYSAIWTHAWNSRFSTMVRGSLSYDDFEGTGGGRRDRTATLGLRATYQWQRWLRLGAEYTRTDRKSNDSLLNYDRDLFLFTLGGTL
jgi:hypothetical protein